MIEAITRFLVVFAFTVIGSGATNGQTVQTGACPTISVVGEADFKREKRREFVVEITGPVPAAAAYHWLVSSGQITDGQGTQKIIVRLAARGDTVTATVQVQGLPTQCDSNASGTITVSYPSAMLIAEFPDEGSEAMAGRLIAAAALLRKNPDNQLLFYEYFDEGTSQFDIRRAVSKVRDFLMRKTKLGESNFSITPITGEDRRTSIYLVPPGIPFPPPLNSG